MRRAMVTGGEAATEPARTGGALRLRAGRRAGDGACRRGGCVRSARHRRECGHGGDGGGGRRLHPARLRGPAAAMRVRNRAAGQPCCRCLRPRNRRRRGRRSPATSRAPAPAPRGRDRGQALGALRLRREASRPVLHHEGAHPQRHRRHRAGELQLRRQPRRDRPEDQGAEGLPARLAAGHLGHRSEVQRERRQERPADRPDPPVLRPELRPDRVDHRRAQRLLAAWSRPCAGCTRSSPSSARSPAGSSCWR